MIIRLKELMRRRAVWAVVWAAVAVFVFFICYLWAQAYSEYAQGDAQHRLHNTQHHLDKAAILIRAAVSLATVGAVLVALFGDWLREILLPIRVRIERLDDDTDMLDDWEDRKEKKTYKVFCLHLVVRICRPLRTV